MSEKRHTLRTLSSPSLPISDDGKGSPVAGVSPGVSPGSLLASGWTPLDLENFLGFINNSPSMPAPEYSSESVRQSASVAVQRTRERISLFERQLDSLSENQSHRPLTALEAHERDMAESRREEMMMGETPVRVRHQVTHQAIHQAELTAVGRIRLRGAGFIGGNTVRLPGPPSTARRYFHSDGILIVIEEDGVIVQFMNNGEVFGTINMEPRPRPGYTYVIPNIQSFVPVE